MTTLDTPAVIDHNDRYWSKIAIFAPVRRSRRNIAITFGMEKTTMSWLPGSEKMKMCLFVSTEYTNVTDEQTDRQTPHDATGCAYA